MDAADVVGDAGLEIAGPGPLVERQREVLQVPVQPVTQVPDDAVHRLTAERAPICGLGMVASLPLTSAMKHFPEDFR